MSRMIFCVDTGIFPSMLCTDTAKYRIKKDTKWGRGENQKKIYIFLNWTE